MFTAIIAKIGIVSAAVIVGLMTAFLCRDTCIDDNPIEEVCEEIIKHETGIEVDFTPLNKE